MSVYDKVIQFIADNYLEKQVYCELNISCPNAPSGTDLFKNNDPIDLANSIVMVMQKDYNSIKSIGFEGRKNVLKKFDVDKMCQSTFTEYKKLIELS